MFVAIGGALCAAVLLLIGWRPWRRNDPAAPVGGGAWSTVLWLTVGVAALHWLLVGAFEGGDTQPGAIWPRSPLRNFPYWHWTFFIALGVLPLGLAEAWLRPVRSEPPAPRHLLRTALIGLGRLICIGAALYFTLIAVIDPAPNVFIQPPPQPLTLLETAGFLILGALPIFVLIVWSEPLAAKLPGASLPLALWLITTASSISFLLFGPIQLALSAAALAVALGGLVVLAWLQPVLRLSHGSLTVVLTLLGAQWAAAVYLTPATRHEWLPVTPAAAMVLLWVGQWSWVTRRPAAQAALIRLGLVALPMGLCLVWASYLYLQEKHTDSNPEDAWGEMLKAPSP